MCSTWVDKRRQIDVNVVDTEAVSNQKECFQNKLSNLGEEKKHFVKNVSLLISLMSASEMDEGLGIRTCGISPRKKSFFFFFGF